MKKKYEKPYVLFEDMRFNSAIASCDWVLAQAGCDLNKTTEEDNAYYSTELGWTYFNYDINTACEHGEIECYHAPTPAMLATAS